MSASALPKDRLSWDGDILRTATPEGQQELGEADGLNDDTEHRSSPDSPGVSIDTTGQSQRELLLKVADDAEVWRNRDGETYLSIPVGDHVEHHALSSRAIRDWLHSEVAQRFTQNGRPASVGDSAFRDALPAIEARYFGLKRDQDAPLGIAEHGSAVYIDGGTPDWAAYKVTSSGWSLVPRAPVPILRTQKAAARPLPATPDILALRAVLPMLDHSQFCLLVAWCLGALAPLPAYPILIVAGEQGTGKSSLVRLARRLVDPTRGDLLQPPANDRDLIAAARHNRVCAFDNLSGLKADLADSLCRLCTGAEIGGRALYSNHDQATFTATRPIILNGIPDLATRGDLANRSILLRLDPITKRQTEADLRAGIEAALPGAFAGLLDALACGLRRREETPPPDTRMSDWARLVVAAEDRLPWIPGTFLDALAANTSEAAAISVESDLVASSIRALLDRGTGCWVGLVSRLFEVLSVDVDPVTKRSGDWPTTPSWFGTRLRRAAPALRTVGIDAQIRRTTRGMEVSLNPI